MASGADLQPAMRLRRLPPAPVALFILLATGLPALAAIVGGWPTVPVLCLQGGLALLASRWLALPWWWQAISTVFLPLAWLVRQAELAPSWFLAGFLLLAATSLGSLKTRVPLYLSSRRAAEEVALRAPAGARVLDLGCGPGGWLAALGTLRPDLVLAGVEMAPLTWLIGRVRLHGRARTRLGSLWQHDLSGYDVVYAYLSPAPMAELWRKVEREMAPGSLFVSNTFGVPGRTPDETVELHDLSRARLLIWRR